MRRALVGVLTGVVALAGAVALISFFQARDDANIGGENGGAPGVAAPDETDPRLAAGNVILTYRREEDGEALRALAEETAGPADPALEEAGAAVIVLRRPNQSAGPIVAHAAGRRLVADSPDDPGIQQFVEYWLGRGADAG